MFSILFLAMIQKLLGISSNDSIHPGNSDLKIFNNFKALNILLDSTNRVVIILGNGKSLSVTAVIIPKVPSAPINKFFKS